MKQKLLLTLSLFGLAATIWSEACSPPDGFPPSCSSQGHQNVPDGTYSNTGPLVTFSCCNHEYNCSGPNVGYIFDKTCTTYYDNNGKYCTDLYSATNYYPTRARCCYDV